MKKQLNPDKFTLAVIAEVTKRGYGERIKHTKRIQPWWGPEGQKFTFEQKVIYMADQMIRLMTDSNYLDPASPDFSETIPTMND